MARPNGIARRTSSSVPAAGVLDGPALPGPVGDAAVDDVDDVPGAEALQQARRHGVSRWTRGKMINLAIDSWIQFTSLPLRISSFVGVSVAFLGIVYAIVLVIRSLVGVPTPHIDALYASVKLLERVEMGG